MKYLARFFTLAILVSAALIYTSCGSDGGGEDSPEKVQLEKLKGTWVLDEVENDGTPRTSEYPDMTLSVTGTFSEGGTYNYTSDADSWPSLSPWKKTDTWKFKSGAVNNTLVRQADVIEMAYTLSNSDNTLVLEFDYAGTGYNNGRVAGTDGSWTFTFTRQ